MQIFDRLIYALIGLVFGALLGVLCWWLYGLGFSLRYDGPGIDPILRDWLMYTGGIFAVLGFVFQEKAGDALGSVIGVIFHFETDSDGSKWVSILILVLVGLVIWYSTR